MAAAVALSVVVVIDARAGRFPEPGESANAPPALAAAPAHDDVPGAYALLAYDATGAPRSNAPLPRSPGTWPLPPPPLSPPPLSPPPLSPSPSPSPPPSQSPSPSPQAPSPPCDPVAQSAATTSITAASVVEHYIDVGRKIRVLAEDRGSARASKLWVSFRYIRINDAILDPAKRGETDARLRRIDDSLAAEYAR